VTDVLMEIRGLSKSYPGVVANDDVSFDIGQHEIHALLGENGAGKSTLVKMIYGLVRPDQGAMTLNGQAFAPSEPKVARSQGVGMVFQHFSLFDALNVGENIALGMESILPQRDLAQRIREVSQAYGLPLDPNRIVGSLSAGERQRVEIIRCLLQNPKLLIMDEPTSVLTPQEVQTLFATLRKLKSEGTSILYISHKLEEIRSLCDTATILRRGKKVAGCTPSDTSAAALAEMMVGASFKAPQKKQHELGETRLSVKALTLAGNGSGKSPISDLSFEIAAGEILGIGGIAGNGQEELLAALSGEALSAPQMCQLNGENIGHLGPNARRTLGLLCAPEERLGHAAAPNMSLIENALLTGALRKKLIKNGFLNWSSAEKFAKTIIDEFDVRTPGTANTAASLSGGNLQKFVIGREVLQDPDVLVVNQPTWGVDAAAAAAIRQSLLDLAAKGAAILIISQDLDELIEISDRFCALYEGRLSQIKKTAGLTIEDIGLMMGSATAEATP
jgi:ABC-type uncharacterized transport system ATPase subunit